MIYAQILPTGQVFNIIEVEDKNFAESLGAVKLKEGFGMNDYYINGEWSHGITPEPPKLETE